MLSPRFTFSGVVTSLAQSIESKATSAVPRLPIDRAFSIKGFGTVVTGTLIAGEIKVGDDLEILPAGIKARVRNVQVHGHDTETAFAGQRTAINLQGINLDQAQRGSVLAPAGRLRATSMIDARLDLLPVAARPLLQRARVRFHHGTAEVMARVVMLGASRDAALLPLEPGGSRIVQLRLEEPITAMPGDRFIIRSYSPQITVGGGIIIDALPEKHRISDTRATARLERLEKADPVERAALFIEMAGHRAMTGTELAAQTGATDDQIAAAARELIASRRTMEVTRSPLILISAESYRELASRVVSLLEEHHCREPLSLGVAREEVRERVFGDARAEVFRSVIARIVEEGKVAAERDSLRLATHKPALSDTEAQAKQALEVAFRAAGFQAQTLEETSASLKISLELARKLYNLLSAEKKIQRVGDMVFHTDSLEELKGRVQARKSVSQRMDVAAFKEITGGLSRKHAIPLLEYLDRERVTRRVGNEREIL